MQLSEVLEKIKASLEHVYNLKSDPKFNNICYDSRKIQLDDIFIAIKGFKLDGHNFIKEAIANGASAIIHQNKISPIGNIPYVKVSNTRKCLAQLACIINSNPSKYLNLIGITGTNGKTTTSYIIEQIIKQAGYNPGVIGTINNRFNSSIQDQSSTTPESLELQISMKNMLKSKITHVILEVSSHALDLYRVDGCNFDIAVFTNLTQDHLDYHNTIEEYWRVKQKLFKKYLNKDGYAIINIDSNKGENLSKNLPDNIKIIKTGTKNECDVKPTLLKKNSNGIKGKITTPSGNFNFHSPLLGNFNLSNILSATGVGIALGIKPIDIAAGINNTLYVPGRLNLLNNSSGIFVYIDYAHTPDALEKVISTIRIINKGRIITIFGCGGNRDTSKRKIMGKTAAKFSDLCIITTDNPRFEDLEHINKQIISGIHEVCENYVDYKKLLITKLTNKVYTVIFDRQEAISIGIKAASPGDSVLIAGKGHEKYQIIRHDKFRFSDQEEAEKVINNILKQKKIFENVTSTMDN